MDGRSKALLPDRWSNVPDSLAYRPWLRTVSARITLELHVRSNPLADQGDQNKYYSTTVIHNYRTSLRYPASPPEISMTDVITILERLVSINSVSPEPGEAEIISYISGLLDEHNIGYEIVEPEQNRQNLIARLPGSEEETLIFNGHVDTKPPYSGWNTDPTTPVVEDGYMIGRGTADMKGGIAAMLRALIVANRDWTVTGPSVEFQFVADEEMNSEFGTQHLIKENYVDDGSFSIVCEPTGSSLVTRSLGNMWLQVTIEGEKSHAGTYVEGTNAVQMASDVVSRLNDDVKAQRYRTDSGRREFPNFNVGYIDGGEHPGSVPAECSVAFETRFDSSRTEEEYRRLVHDVLDQIVVEEYGGTYSVTEFGGGGIPPWDIDDFPSEPVDEYIETIKKSYRRVTGENIRTELFRGGSDAGFLTNRAGIPSVIFGPGTLSQAHTANERIKLEAVRTMANTYERLIRDW